MRVWISWAVLLLAGLPCAVAAPGAGGRTRLVHDQAEYAAAARGLGPGDTVVLADGEWRDFQVLLAGKGAPGRPITLTAQTPGKVVLSGQSNLRLAGEHLVVSNLVFRDGWSPTGEVVAFRRSRSERASHSRVTGVVIDRFNKPDRGQSDNWVAMYGQYNRFDHNHLAGKTNQGATMVVVRDPEQGLDNRHRIDHNYFGPRPNLGSNGGETLRVGTSHDSLSASNTVVENNWFEGCDGEVEIVSNKSGGNTYRGNVFFQSRGALVLRHGDGNLVEGNFFFGGNKPHTGGIRVINRRQTVRNNYLEGLAGEGFASALSVMYGVPDSPLNRYVQVEDAVIEHNTIVDARSIVIGAGKDEERSAAPVRSTMARNLIVNSDGHDPVQVPGDLSGIALEGNVQGPAAAPALAHGTRGGQVRMQRNNAGVLVPVALDGVGMPPELRPVARGGVGVSWYPKHGQAAKLDSGREHAVAPGEDTLTEALAGAGPGDRLRLQPGRYMVNQVLALRQPLTVEGPERGEAVVVFSRPQLFHIEAGGKLRLARLTISGEAAPDEVGNAVVLTRPGSGAANYELLIEDSTIRDLKVNRGFDVVATGKGSMADLIALRRVTVVDASGAVLAAAAETDDRGTYNAERVEIEASTFQRIDGPAVNLYRGGTDESTFGPRIRIQGSRFEQVGKGGAAVRLHGVQHAQLEGNRFAGSGTVRFTHSVGKPVLVAQGNEFSGTPPLESDVAIAGGAP